MAGKYYRVERAILLGDGIEVGRVVSSEDLKDCGGADRCRELVKNGALKELSDREGELLKADQEAADAAAQGGVEDQSFHETVADRLAAPERERMAKEAAGAKPPEGQLESPRVSLQDEGGRK